MKRDKVKLYMSFSLLLIKLSLLLFEYHYDEKLLLHTLMIVWPL